MKHKVILTLVLISFFASCTGSYQKMINTETTDIYNKKNIFGLVDKNNNWFEFSGEGAVLSQGVVTGYSANSDKKGTLVKIPINDIKRIFLTTTGIADGFLNLISGLGILTHGTILWIGTTAFIPAVLISVVATLL